jgi:hypothetical protein
VLGDAAAPDTMPRKSSSEAIAGTQRNLIDRSFLVDAMGRVCSRPLFSRLS